MAKQSRQGGDADELSSADLLEIAKRAAAEKRPDEMITALAASHFLDGLKGRLSRDWQGRLPAVELDECIAEAVDSTYDAVNRGKSINNLGAWLWKAAANKARDRWNDEYVHRRPGHIEELEDAGFVLDGDNGPDQGLAEHRRAEAIRVARRLLPRIGQGQIVEVMTVVIDAVEQGVHDLPSSAIAGSLGLSVDSVRALLSRGFERLTREARGEGISLPTDVPELAMGEDAVEGRSEQTGN